MFSPFNESNTPLTIAEVLMMHSVWATVRDGQIKLLEPESLPEGAQLLVTVLENSDDREFWQRAQRSSMKAVWDNPGDDIYAEVL